MDLGGALRASRTAPVASATADQFLSQVRPRGLLTCPLPRQLELDSKFRNHTCGLCGDYNGLQTYSEFLSEGERLLGGLRGRVRAGPPGALQPC